MSLAYRRNKYLRIAQASVSVGDYTTIGNMVLLAKTDTDADGFVEYELPFEAIIHNLLVKGQDNAGNAPVAVGDYVYRDGADWNVDAVNGIKFGIALGTVTSGDVDGPNIDVLQVSP